jgi:hypothetical protein
MKSRSTRHLPWRETAWATAAVLLLLAFYALAYFVSVDREVVVHDAVGTPEIAATYAGGRWIKALFVAVHQIDRSCRPAYWAGDDLFHDEAP